MSRQTRSGCRLRPPGYGNPRPPDHAAKELSSSLRDSPVPDVPRWPSKWRKSARHADSRVPGSARAGQVAGPGLPTAARPPPQQSLGSSASKDSQVWLAWLTYYQLPVSSTRKMVTCNCRGSGHRPTGRCVSVRPRLTHGGAQKPIRGAAAANPVVITVGRRAARSRPTLMNGSQFQCRSGACIAAVQLQLLC